jgi:hypothetical protein
MPKLNRGNNNFLVKSCHPREPAAAANGGKREKEQEAQ